MRRTAVVATIVCAANLVVAGSGVSALRVAAPGGFELPKPTGRYAVGTTTWRLVDSSRRETFTGSREFRNVEVLAWYPARSPRAGDPAPYLREGLSEVRVFATLFGLAETAFDALEHVQTHAALDAAPADGGKLPVLVFSHGYTGIPSAHTALLEELASHGYAVLSVVHPYESTAATLADGRGITMLQDGKPLPQILEVFDEWEAEDKTMAAVTGAANDTERLRLLREYLAGLRKTDLALKRWVDDTKLVVDRLGSLPRASAAGRLAARLDLGRLGVFGHSMGGVTAGQFCSQDRRCRAGLNLDGIPQYGAMIDTPMQRPFLMVYSARPGRLGASDVIYQRAVRPYYRVDVENTRHLDFIDMTFWGGALRQRPVLGTIAPARVAEITAAVVRDYFDQELLGKRSSLLAGAPLFPEIAVKTFREAVH